MTRTRKTLMEMTALLVIAGLAAWPTPVSARGPVEICGNGMDDDGDGATDEDRCRTSPTSSPTSGDGIVPELWNDNPNCKDMGYGYGFKIDMSPNGTFTFTSANGELTGGAPSDPNNSVTISNSDGTYFDWSSTLGIDAVFVKGGPEGGNLYVYDPEDMGDSGLSTPGAASDISHIEFCYDYELTATKTANATYTRTYTWDITKSVNPDTHTGFAGDNFSSDYDVLVDQTVTDSNFAVSGSITVNNPTPFTVSFSVSDSAGGTPAVVTCPSYTLAPGANVVCTYTASLASKTDGTNTATVTSNTSGVGGATATAGYTFGDPTTTVGFPTINVTDSVQGPLGSASGDHTFEYSRDFSCSSNPADYTNGFDSDTYPNTATIDETGQSDDASVTVNCYAPVVTKDASTEWRKLYEWTITKSVDPDTHTGFAGDSFSSDYDVVVDQTITEYGFKAFGTIYVSNPAGAPGSIMVDVADAVNGYAATVDCGGGSTSLTVAAGATETCSYTVDLPDNTDRTNTATVTFNTIDFLATATVDFGDPIIEGFPTINVTDTYAGDLGSASGDHTFEYSRDFSCSSNPTDYTNGFDSDTYPNTATIDETGQSDDASVTVNCYAPVVTKDASASYDERHTWDIEKSVDPTSQSGYPGDTLSWTWTVNLSESSVDENFAVSGQINVSNPAGSPGNMTVSLVDALNDGTPAMVDCGGGATSVVVAPGTTETCAYSASPADASATLNTATATFNSIDFTATADVNFIANVINGSAVVDDNQEPDFNPDGLTVYAGGGPWTWTETQSHTCSTSAADYGEDGTYSDTLYNTATVNASDGQSDSASAQTTYTCEAGFVDLKKLTDGVVNDTQDWQFALYLGPDGFGGTQVGTTSSTLGDADGVLEFGGPALRPDTTYTVCELNVPAGWTSFWQVDVDGDGIFDATVVPYNPNADDPTQEDLGNRCVDFGAGTTIPVTVGTTIHFQVDNTFPGGEPRTPGYWKNWNRCTGGNQDENADRNGGWEEGFWLLEDVLDPSIGGGIVWDDILDDGFLFPITTCEDAVSILDQRDLSTGKKMASDAAYTLAMHLLAAQLNFGAGAETCQTALDAALAAETLLDKYNFNGTGDYLRPKGSTKADYYYALQLATTLDQYNNGNLCP